MLAEEVDATPVSAAESWRARSCPALALLGTDVPQVLWDPWEGPVSLCLGPLVPSPCGPRLEGHISLCNLSPAPPRHEMPRSSRPASSHTWEVLAL